MKKVFPSLSVTFIMICIGFSCNIFRPCCNKTIAPSVMSLLTGKQWQFDSFYEKYTGPGTGELQYARGFGYNEIEADNMRSAFWPDGTADAFDNSGEHKFVLWRFTGVDSANFAMINPDGSTTYGRILKLDATHLTFYDSTNHYLDVQVAKPIPVPERIKDSLIQVFNVTDATKKLAYNNYFKANLYKADTTSKRQDSIVINYLNKKGDTLRTETKRYGPGVTLDHKSICDSIYILYDSSVIFYNKEKQLEYAEFWRYAGIACISDLDGEGMGGGCCFHMQYSTPELSGRIRISHNKKGKETLSILTNIEGRMMRYRSYYDKYGKRTDSTQESIEYYQFWDN